jgi:hypothetical protein
MRYVGPIEGIDGLDLDRVVRVFVRKDDLEGEPAR